ncbi:DUF1523 domain-containing protein [Clostridium sp. CM028]|uniref:DUF1523 domain-containing protein n=1 Tax=unclassified Clostridium TaxID=2614128 RepID=UPI001C0AC5F6|nr:MULTISPECIES: DUF1523 domain-containing protein [unclassified Clostridium]MBU3091635.1 DUF1523 domain-containing protein [Clostridium sp. CF011]MBW9144100.1 DUF1523 domain-containing protein [Clostridium sp. CM027]MBW9147589.1 DUF1523 domain-containing protein [Clostridium sp. CM028]UVE41254.1 DUF1523 domain-containing protein [Clostridium sp. CM027]WAG70249.1 DUF1523 domain-containing protein [Clostridium sp. CF011]
MIKNISYKFRDRFFSKFKIGKIIIIIIVMVGVGIFFPHFFRNTYTVTIANKRIIRHDNIDRYLIYAQMENGDIKVFEDANSLLEFKIHSEDVYWGLTINRKYEIKAYGLSIPLLSYYQNITKIKGLNREK